jgi:hypothetical protein
VLAKLLTLLVALPLLWPPGACPYAVFGGDAPVHHAPDGDCDCPVLKHLTAPDGSAQPLPRSTLDHGPVAVPAPAVPLPHHPSGVVLFRSAASCCPVYLTVRALRI